MSKLPVFEHFLSVGNLEPKLEWFFKPKLKPKLFLLNRLPGTVSLLGLIPPPHDEHDREHQEEYPRHHGEHDRRDQEAVAVVVIAIGA